MRCPKTNVPVLKPTNIVTTMPELAERLLTCRCHHLHKHAHLEGAYKGLSVSFKSGQFEDLSEEHKPMEEDHELEDDLWEEPNVEEEQLEQGPKKIGRSFYRSDEYWGRRAEGAPPLGPLHEDVDLPQLVRPKSSRA